MKVRFLKTTRKRQVLLGWIVSYLLILLIPLCSFAYCYAQITNAIRQTTADSSALSLKNIRMEFDGHLAQMRSTMSFVLTNQPFQRLSKTASFDENILDDLTDCINDISSYCKTSTTQTDVLIYFENQDYIVTSSTANQSMPIYYSTWQHGTGMTHDAWVDILSAKRDNAFLVSDHLSYAFSSSSCVVYCHTLATEGRKIHIYISRPTTAFSALLPKDNKSFLLLSSEKGDLFYDFSAASPVSAMPIADWESGRLIQGSDGLSYIGTYAASQRSDYYYQYFTLENIYWSVLKGAQQHYYVWLTTALLLSLSCMWFFLRKNYRPIHSILRKLSGPETYGNEFKVIEHTIEQLHSENINLKDTVRQQDDSLRSHALFRYLQSGVYPVGDDDSQLLTDLREKRFWIVCLQMVQPPEGSHSSHADSENVDLGRYTVRSVCDELFAKFPFELVEGELISYLIYPEEDHLDEWLSEKDSLFETINDFFADELETPLVLIHSGGAVSFEDMPEQYGEIFEATNTLVQSGGQGIIRLPDFYSQKELLCQLKDSHHKTLFDAIQAGDYQTCKTIIRNIFSETPAMTKRAFLMLRLAMIEYISPILNIYFHHVHDSVLRSTLVDKLDLLLSAQSPSRLEEMMCDLTMFSCQTISKNYLNSRNLIASAKNYVAQNYANSNLTINEIAEVLSRNAKYLSHTFSAQAGMPLSDYINSVRVSHACRLMFERDDPQEVIASLTGFNNVRTFRRAFTKVTGQSPSQYKNQGKPASPL